MLTHSQAGEMSFHEETMNYSCWVTHVSLLHNTDLTELTRKHERQWGHTDTLQFIIDLLAFHSNACQFYCFLIIWV